MTEPDKFPVVDGAKIRDARLAQGGSQAALATRLGVTPVQISKWENGHHEPSSRYLRLLSIALGVPMEELLADERKEDS